MRNHLKYNFHLITFLSYLREIHLISSILKGSNLRWTAVIILRSRCICGFRVRKWATTLSFMNQYYDFHSKDFFLFFLKENNIYLFKLIVYIKYNDMIKYRYVKCKFANELTTFKLITFKRFLIFLKVACII